jgi:hypothetical protein
MILSATDARLTDEIRTVLSGEVYLAVAVVSAVLVMQMAAFALLGAEAGAEGYWGTHMPTLMASTLHNRAGSAINPAGLADKAKVSDTTSLVLRAYEGKQGEAAACLQADSIEMAAEGYFPTWQNWAPGEWAREAYVVAALLIFLFGVGILILAYLLIVEPAGTLTVTYERRAAALGYAKG